MKLSARKPKQFGGFLTNVLGVAGVVFAGFLIIYPYIQKKSAVQQKEAVISARQYPPRQDLNQLVQALC
jgi:hypothetical protein